MRDLHFVISKEMTLFLHFFQKSVCFFEKDFQLYKKRNCLKNRNNSTRNHRFFSKKAIITIFEKLSVQYKKAALG